MARGHSRQSSASNSATQVPLEATKAQLPLSPKLASVENATRPNADIEGPFVGAQSTGEHRAAKLVKTAANTSKLFSIVNFLSQCSRHDLAWMADQYLNQLSTLLSSTTSSQRPACAQPRESSLVSRSQIHVDKASHQIHFPSHPEAPEERTKAAAKLLLCLCADASDDGVMANKASRMRIRIAAAVVVRSFLSRLCETGVLGTLEKALQSEGTAAGMLWRIYLPHFSGSITSSNVLQEATITTREAPVARALPFPPDQPLSTLIIPSAGRSSRFPGHKPKWLLTMPNGRLMVIDALSKLDFTCVSRVVLGVLKEHVDKHCGGTVEPLFKAFYDGIPELSTVQISIVVIGKETRDQVQTIEAILRTAEVTGPIYLKDCDNQFASSIPGIDAVASLEINKEMQNLNIPGGKSYLAPDADGNIDNIVEKVILGPHFCVGGYSFASGRDFIQRVQGAREIQRLMNGEHVELAVSDIVWLKLCESYCIRSPMTQVAEFQALPTHDYEDWGTLGAWEAYARTFRTLFIDIDGTLIKNSGGYFAPIWGERPPLPHSIAHLQKLREKGRTQIILTTSRSETFREVTIKQLEKCGVPYDQIVFGMFHAQRVLINDFAKTNPFPSAVAINLRRDGDELGEMLGEY